MKNKKTIAIIIAALVVVLTVGIILFFVLGKKVEVTFDTNGGTAISSVKIKKNTTVEKPEDPTRDGYVFDGWYLDDEEFDFSTKVTEDITLEAEWSDEEEAGIYTIKFDSNGGEDVKAVKTENGKIVSLPTPTKEGYKFIGWYDGKTEYKVGDKVTKDITLSAKWKKDNGTTYTVKFDTDGGSEVASQKIAKNNLVSKPVNPTKKGYTFVEWQFNGKTFDFKTKITSNITLKAVWKTYEVKPVVRPEKPTTPEEKKDVYTMKFTAYDGVDEIGAIQVFKNDSTTPIEFIELQNASGSYIGKYNSEDKGMRNANTKLLGSVAKVKLTDGTVVSLTK